MTSYKMMQKTKDLWIPLIIILVTALAVYAVPSNSYPLVYFRWIIGAIFTLVLHGYTLADALFSEKIDTLIEKLMSSFAFSALTIGLLGYLLNALPCGISLSSVFISLSLVTISSILIKIFRKKHHSITPKIENLFASLQQLQKSHYIILALIITFGTIVKTIPFMKVNALLDLDPNNHYMKVNAILENGRIPDFDHLSLAPQGTSSTYTITPLGFEFLIVTLEFMTQAPLVKLMGILPAIYGVLTMLAMFFLSLEITKSVNASLLATFFTAFSVSWLLIYGVTMNPLAENIGLFLFPLALLHLTRYIKNKQRHDILYTGILFGTMFYIHLFTVFYYALTLLGYVAFSFLIKEKTKIIFKAIIEIFGTGICIAIPIIFQIAPLSIQQGNAYSKTASIMAFASGSYLTLVPQDIPKILSLPISNLAIVTLWLIVGIVAVKIAWKVLHKNFEEHESLLLPASCCFTLFLAGIAPIFEPLRNILVNVPFSATLFYAHRLVPYLTLALYILIAIAITNYILLIAKKFNRTLRLKNKNIPVNYLTIFLITTLVGAPFLVSSIVHTNELASWPTAQDYTAFFDWVKQNTNAHDIFIVNSWDMSMWLRAIGKRPTVFSHVHQDLVALDAEKRMWFHAVIFNEGANLYSETIRLLKEYNVSYVVVTSKPVYLDVINHKWVFSIQNLNSYIKKMDSKYYFEKVYYEEDRIWVYKVNL